MTGNMAQATPNRREWIDARLAAHHAAVVASSPAKQLAAKFDAAFPHPNPRKLEDQYPFAAIALAIEYARRFQGAKVIIADGFAEVELVERADGSARAAA